MCLLWKTNASITFWLPAGNNYLQIGPTTYQLINSQQWLMPSTTSSPKSHWNHFCPQAFTKAGSAPNICLGSSYHCSCNSVEQCAKWKLSHSQIMILYNAVRHVFLHNHMWSVILLWSVRENFASSFLGPQFQAE